MTKLQGLICRDGFGNPTGIYSFNQKTGKYRTLRHLSDRSTDIPSWSQDGKLMVWTEKNLCANYG